MQEKVLVIGGARNQCHAVEQLKKYGYYTIVVDYNPESAAKEVADLFVQISTIDVQTIIERFKGENLIAVVAVQSDLGLSSASIIAKEFGLRHIPGEYVELFTDKHKMRKFLEENHFLYPSYKKCQNTEDVRAFAEEYGYPFVMKPLDSQGSRGVCIISKASDIEKMDESAKFSRKEESVIVEEYLGNQEYTVEGIVIDGKHHSLAVSKKTHYDNLECVSKELYYSWEEEYEELISNHDRLIEATGLPLGVTHSEYIKNEKGFVLVEFTARGGGAMISSHIVPKISGWDVEDIYIRQLLGKEIIVPEKTRYYAVLKFIELQEGVIKKISGVREIREMKNVLYFELMYQEGDYVQAVINDTNRHGHYIVWATSEQELRDIMDQVENALNVEMM